MVAIQNLISAEEVSRTASSKQDTHVYRSMVVTLALVAAIGVGCVLRFMLLVATADGGKIGRHFQRVRSRWRETRKPGTCGMANGDGRMSDPGLGPNRGAAKLVSALRHRE
jgi:hypothetical protein